MPILVKCDIAQALGSSNILLRTAYSPLEIIRCAHVTSRATSRRLGCLLECRGRLRGLADRS